MKRIVRIGGKARIVGSRPKAAPRAPREKAPKRSLVAQYKDLVLAMPATAATPAEIRKVKANAAKQAKLVAKATPEDAAAILAWEKARTAARHGTEPKAAEPKAAKKAAEPKAKRASKPKASKPKAAKAAKAAKRTSKKAAEPKAKRASKPKASKPKAAKAAKRTSKKAAEPTKPAAKRYTPGGVLRALQELGGKATLRQLRHQIGRDQLDDAVDELQRRSLIAVIPGADAEHHMIALV